MTRVNFELIREKVKSGDYRISVHALKRLSSRQHTIADLENAIVKGESIHVVCSLAPDTLIVTVYFPDEDRWAKDRYRK